MLSEKGIFSSAPKQKVKCSKLKHGGVFQPWDGGYGHPWVKEQSCWLNVWEMQVQLLPHRCFSSHPPRRFFFSWALARHNPSPWFCSVPQDAAAATTDNKPSPSACGSIRGAATAFPHETDSSASHWDGDLLCKGLVLYKPWNKSVFL